MLDSFTDHAENQDCVSYTSILRTVIIFGCPESQVLTSVWYIVRWFSIGLSRRDSPGWFGLWFSHSILFGLFDHRLYGLAKHIIILWYFTSLIDMVQLSTPISPKAKSISVAFSSGPIDLPSFIPSRAQRKCLYNPPIGLQHHMAHTESCHLTWISHVSSMH